MLGNPYSVLAQTFSSQDTALSLCFGKIETVSPLSINVAGLVIGSESIFISAELAGKAEDAVFSIPSSEISGASGTVQKKNIFQKGDRLLLASDQNQVFYLICKVVSA